MPHPRPAFPDYTGVERIADGLIHFLGLVGAPLAVTWLFAQAGPSLSTGRIICGAIYSFGLVGMLYASALYNLARAGRLKAILRRLDHAMIYIMIAGTYTPLSLTALRPGLGIPLCAIVWTMAAAGVALKLLRPYRYERAALALYLGMGWSLLPLLPALIADLPASVMALIVGGGVVYSVGTVVHTQARLPFHNALWHALVIAAAGLHLVAIAKVMTLPAA
jgi:hemolysin III